MCIRDSDVRAWLAACDAELLVRRKAIVADRRRVWEARMSAERERARVLEEQALHDDLANVVRRQLPGWGMAHARLIYRSQLDEAEALREARAAAFRLLAH